MGEPKADIEGVLHAQRRYLRSGATLPREFRLQQLNALRDAIRPREEGIFDALISDLHKGAFETYTSEIGMIYEEMRHTRKHLRRWMKPRRVSTPLVHAPGSSRILYRPRGVSAIIAPWNYPFQLALAPLVAAISAGNTAIVKPSEFAPATAELIAELIGATFAPEYIACVTGDGAVAAELTGAPVDHIFFTGSTGIGRQVMRAAARHLTPVTLELGGKSPAIVTQNARLEVAARRVAWARYLNAGQTCVATDYVCVHRSVHERFVTLLAGTIGEFFGDTPQGSPDYGRIINERHYRRLTELMARQERETDGGAPVIGGATDDTDRYIAPTVYSPAGWDDPVMEDELFGPLLPVIPYDDFSEVIETIAARPTPLAAYLFSESQDEITQFETTLPFGGATVNDAIVHLVNPELPFGGCGPSGHGSYHGKAGFTEFSHETSIMRRSTRFDIPLKYPPYGRSLKLIRRVLRP